MTTSTTTGFLSAYDFDGDPDALLAGYDKLLASFPPETLILNVCIQRDGGITVYDTCPDRPTFEAFSTSDDFANALSGAGLPAPTAVRPLGAIHQAIAR